MDERRGEGRWEEMGRRDWGRTDESVRNIGNKVLRRMLANY